MIHQAVAQSVETWLRCELISWELFDVLIIPLIARLAWAPALLLAAIFIIIIIPLSSAMGCLWQPIEPYVKKL